MLSFIFRSITIFCSSYYIFFVEYIIEVHYFLRNGRYIWIRFPSFYIFDVLFRKIPLFTFWKYFYRKDIVHPRYDMQNIQDAPKVLLRGCKCSEEFYSRILRRILEFLPAKIGPKYLFLRTHLFSKLNATFPSPTFPLVYASPPRRFHF